MKNGNLWPNVPAGLHALQLIRVYTLHKHAARARCNRSPEEPLRCAPVAGTARRAGFWRRSAAPRYRAPSLTIHAGAARCTGLQAAAFTYLQAYAQVSKGWCGLDRSAYPRLCGRCSQDSLRAEFGVVGGKCSRGPSHARCCARESRVSGPRYQSFISPRVVARITWRSGLPGLAGRGSAVVGGGVGRKRVRRGYRGGERPLRAVGPVQC